MDRADFDELVKNASLSADSVAMRRHPTEAQRTRAIVERTLLFAFGNGLIDLKPRAEWPAWMTIDPPFDNEIFRGGRTP